MEEEKTREALWDEVTAERGNGEPAAKPTQAAAKEVINPEVKTETAQVATENTEAAKPTTEELLAQALARVEKLEGRTRNVEGHIGGLTSQQKTLQETVAAAKEAAVAVKEAPTQAQVKAAASNPEEWEKLKEDFPEWSVATERMLDSRLAGIKAGADEATVSKLVADAVDKAKGEITQQIVNDSLTAVFPTWKKDINTPEFAEWVKAQSDEVRALAGSSDVGDAAQMLSLFGQSKKANPVQQILDSRKQKLDASVAAPRGSRPAVAKTWEQMTPEERWNSEAKSRERASASN